MTKYISILLAGFSLSSSAMEIEESFPWKITDTPSLLKVVIPLAGESSCTQSMVLNSKKENGDMVWLDGLIVDPIAHVLYAILIKNTHARITAMHAMTGHIHKEQKVAILPKIVVGTAHSCDAYDDAKKRCILIEIKK